MGIIWLCRRLNAKVIDLYPEERMGDALIEIQGARLYLECVSTYDYISDKSIPVRSNNFDQYANNGISKIFDRLQLKIHKKYSDGRSLLIIIDHPFPMGRRTLDFNAVLIRSNDISSFGSIYMIELLTKYVCVVKQNTPTFG
jgi:hypothetical protein